MELDDVAERIEVEDDTIFSVGPFLELISKLADTHALWTDGHISEREYDDKLSTIFSTMIIMIVHDVKRRDLDVDERTEWLLNEVDKVREDVIDDLPPEDDRSFL